MIGRKLFCRVAIVAVLACFIVFAIPVVPQNKDINAEIKFAARAELVLIPTLVTDKSGNHITGLKKEDFTVLEDGAEQKIASFEEITSDPHGLSRPKQPNEFSNSLAGDSPNRGITLMVLDLINTGLMDQAKARQALLTYLTHAPDQCEPTALYTLTGNGIHLVHDFTSDPRVLAAVLHDAFKTADFPMVDSPEQRVDEIAGARLSDYGSLAHGIITHSAEMAERQRLGIKRDSAVTKTSLEMGELAQEWIGVPGRKSLIWVGDELPLVSQDSIQLLNQAQIALYPVDAAGIQALLPDDERIPEKEGSISTTRATLPMLASMTGGRAYYGSNDLVKGFRDAVNDSAEFYVLGYYLDRSKTGAGWHNLALKVKREHAEIRARGGFFVTNATVDPENSRNSDISSALQSPLDYTSLPLVARWDKVEAGLEPGKKHVNYQIQLAPDAALIDDADNYHLALDFVTLVKTPDGKKADQPNDQKFDTHLTPEKLASIRQNGVGYSGFLDLAPGEYTVRFVVRDNLSGRIGSVTAPLFVPTAGRTQTLAKHHPVSRDTSEKAKSYVDYSLPELQKALPELRGLKPDLNQDQLPLLLAKVGQAVEALLRKMPSLLSHEQVKEAWDTADGMPAMPHMWKELDEGTPLTFNDKPLKDVPPLEFDYLILFHEDPANARTTIEEYRTDPKGRAIQPGVEDSRKPQGLGFADAWMLFVPSELSQSRFHYLGEQQIDEHEVFVVAFAQDPRLVEVPAEVAFQGTLIPFFHQGIAWIDESTFRIVRLRTDLLYTIPSIQLQRLTAQLQFDDMHVSGMASPLWLPREVDITSKFKDQISNEIHRYSNYRLYAASSKIVPATP
jgi:VWFA-related protein